MRCLTDQHTPSPVKALREQPLLRKGAGLIEQTIRFNPFRKNGGQLIEKRTALQRAALLATSGALHHLEAPLPKAERRKGLWTKQSQARSCASPRRTTFAVRHPWR